MVIVVLVLLLCLAVPILIVTACMVYCLLSGKTKANGKLSPISPPTISTIESANVAQSASNVLHSDLAVGKTSVAKDNALNSDDPATATTMLKFTRTPFGTRTTFDLGSSLQASWTINRQSNGPNSLAAALEGVLALHRHLEELRLQQPQEYVHGYDQYNMA